MNHLVRCSPLATAAILKMVGTAATATAIQRDHPVHPSVRLLTTTLSGPSVRERQTRAFTPAPVWGDVTHTCTHAH